MLSAELTVLTTKCGQNVLRESNLCEMWITQNDLDGLPAGTIEAYALAAKKKGREGEYLVTVSYPSYGPFMQYSSRAALRENLYMLYNTRHTKGEYDNTEIIKKITQTRMEIHKLVDYKNS